MKEHWSNCVKKNFFLNIMLIKKNKNLTFMLPTFCKKNKKMTVVMMLLIALKQNIKNNAKN